MSKRAGRSHSGVYGLALDGIHPTVDLLNALPSSSSRLRVERAPAAQWSRYGTPSAVDDLVDGGRVALFAEDNLAVFDFVADVPDDEMVHPWLVPAISQLAVRNGRIVLHGGVLAAGGLAIAVLGDRQAGKSTLMGVAASGAGGVSVLADDLVVIEGDVVHAGPRCVDLRPSSVPLLPSLLTAASRDGTRRRAMLPRCAATAHLAGFVILSWGAEVELSPVAPARRIAALIPHMSAGQTRRDFDRVLALAQLPVWLLQRPKNADFLDHTLALLMSTAFGGPHRASPLEQEIAVGAREAYG